uniref:Uncharacterized protein n=1 Tax=Panagrolaimus sp. JU765 TaxID=591449 RepID=A0AC34R4H7_9BILA
MMASSDQELDEVDLFVRPSLASAPAFLAASDNQGFCDAEKPDFDRDRPKKSEVKILYNKNLNFEPNLNKFVKRNVSQFGNSSGDDFGDAVN